VGDAGVAALLRIGVSYSLGRLLILAKIGAKPAVANGAPRSDVNTNGDWAPARAGAGRQPLWLYTLTPAGQERRRLLLALGEESVENRV
jgi:hypothetical protein